jgi:hypothetical protein
MHTAADMLHANPAAGPDICLGLMVHDGLPADCEVH